MQPEPIDNFWSSSYKKGKKKKKQFLPANLADDNLVEEATALADDVWEKPEKACEPDEVPSPAGGR